MFDLPLSDASTQSLRDAVECLARTRRDALLLELSQLERMLCISPTTSELRREWRTAQPLKVRIMEG